MIGASFQAAFSYVYLGGPAVQRILWIFVLSLVLPWIFLFIDFGFPRNRQQVQPDHNVQQHEQEEGFAERIPQAMAPEMEQGPERHFGREDDE